MNWVANENTKPNVTKQLRSHDVRNRCYSRALYHHNSSDCPLVGMFRWPHWSNCVTATMTVSFD